MAFLFQNSQPTGSLKILSREEGSRTVPIEQTSFTLSKGETASIRVDQLTNGYLERASHLYSQIWLPVKSGQITSLSLYSNADGSGDQLTLTGDDLSTLSDGMVRWMATGSTYGTGPWTRIFYDRDGLIQFTAADFAEIEKHWYYDLVQVKADNLTSWTYSWSGFEISTPKLVAGQDDFVENRSLFVDLSDLDDPDGMGEVVLQWQYWNDQNANGVQEAAEWENIVGATASELLLTDDHTGLKIRYRVNYQDQLGYQETVYSPATDYIVNINDEVKGALKFTSGTPKINSEVIVSAEDLIDEDGLGYISFSWYVDGVLLQSGPQTEFWLDGEVGGSSLEVNGVYTDLKGNVETVSYAANIDYPAIGAVFFEGFFASGQVVSINAANIVDKNGIASDLEYRWYKNDELMAGVNGPEYLLHESDIGSTIDAKVLFTDGDGNVESMYVSGASDILLSVGANPSDMVGTVAQEFFHVVSNDTSVEAKGGSDVVYITGEYAVIDAGSGEDVIHMGGEIIHASNAIALNISSEVQVGTEEVVRLQGKTLISHVVDGGAEIDTIVLTDGSDALALHDVISGISTSALLSVDSFGQTTAQRINSIEEIYLGAGDDVVDLTSPDYQMDSEYDQIHVYGEAGNDIMWGSQADEILNGGEGDDILFGGAGADELVGGEGADEFQFTQSSQGDTILDFDLRGGDTLKFFNTGGASFNKSNMNIIEQAGFESSKYFLEIEYSSSSSLQIGLQGDEVWLSQLSVEDLNGSVFIV